MVTSASSGSCLVLISSNKPSLFCFPEDHPFRFPSLLYVEMYAIVEFVNQISYGIDF